MQLPNAQWMNDALTRLLQRSDRPRAVEPPPQIPPGMSQDEYDKHMQQYKSGDYTIDTPPPYGK